MSASVILVDTFSLFFRAYYALPAMSTRSGVPTSALYGLSVLLLKLLREHPGAAIALALDAPEATFRHDAFAAYKAGRAAVPEALVAQLRRLPGLLESLGAPAFRVPGFEADDILATLAKRARVDNQSALVVSGDRDLLQLAHGSVRVSFVGRRGKEASVYDEAAVVHRFGIPPVRLPAYMALVGDPSDNLPSVPGIGPVTARKLFSSWRSCADLFANLDAVDSVRLREILSLHRQQILRSEELARLRDDVPLPLEGPGPSWVIPTTESLRALAKKFEELEFHSLLPRLDRLIAAAGATRQSTTFPRASP